METSSRRGRRASSQPGTKCATRACDQCRLRKTRCSLSRPCELCVSNGFECTFLKPQKKRGPPAHRVKQIREQQSQFRVLHATSSNTDVATIPEPACQLSSLDTPEASDLRGDTHITQLSMPNQFGNVNQSNGNGYDGLLSGNTTATTWNGPDLNYWLPDTFNSQAYPSFGFEGSNIFVKQTLPPIIDDSINLEPNNQAPFLPPNIDSDMQRDNLLGVQPEFWPPYIHETSLVPWIDVYFDRLHPTLPVLNRSLLFTQILQQEHRRNPQFGAMILSLCAFSLTQPIDISERPTSSSRSDQAKILVNEATRMRTSSDFGEHPSIDAVLTSFFLFGYLFGSNQHNAARLRLREAIDLASTLGLNNSAIYAERSTEEKGQWLRTFLVLSVTERAYALQRQHPISFTGRPMDIIRAADEIRNAAQRVVSGIIVHTEKDAAGMMGLSLLMELFDAIDEDILICWNARCNVTTNHGRCHILTEEKALSIYRNLARVSDASRYRGKNNDQDHFDLPSSDVQPVPDRGIHERQCGSKELNEARLLRDFLSDTQCADILVTQKWVQDRLWNLCFNHNLLHLHPGSGREQLSLRYAFENAQSALRLCQSLRISSLEAHGVGIIEKLYNIASSALLTVQSSITGPPESDLQVSKSPMQILANNYLKLLRTLRGGNHPYLEQYKAHLIALGWEEDT
ncbi:hypothetical protein BJY04DRAFT_174671 [Aspergillus karnatakaensis]|uniref:CeGAL family transcription factor n=1 Tax=Aspergillus karnatakaensis TaxID=1810916 RepID=UPI003CCCD0B4